MIAQMTMYGTAGEVEYLGVVVQTAPINHGGSVTDSRFVDRTSYPNPEAMISDAMDWIRERQVDRIYHIDELVPPDDKLSHRRYDGLMMEKNDWRRRAIKRQEKKDARQRRKRN